MTDLQSLLDAGDVDALRRFLGEASSTQAPTTQLEPSVPMEAADPLVSQATHMATSMLKQGLVHLEADAERRSVRDARDAADTCARPLVELPDLGLRLVSQPVMGQAVWLLRHRSLCHGASVIELGAGCGAPGLVALGAGAHFVALTDLDEEVVPLMDSNRALNSSREPNLPATVGDVASTDTVCETGLLDWKDDEAIARWAGRPQHAVDTNPGYHLVLAADVTFSVGDIAPMARAVPRLLIARPTSRFVLARSAWFEDLQPTLVARMEEAGLALLSEQADSDAGATVLEFGPST
jgi:predicted nicotinamide N-methyase